MSGDQTRLREELERRFGRETVDAEQRLSATQPLHLDNYLQRLLRAYSKNFSSHGDLPSGYRSSEGNVFRLPSFLLPAAGEGRVVTLEKIRPDLRERFFEVIAGERYVRFFVHPADIEHFSGFLRDARPDPRVWYASPTSSHRSLFVFEPDLPRDAGLILKVSLRRRIMGFSREIGGAQVVRAVGATAFLHQAYERSRGQLPGSGMRWFYFPEFFSFLPEGLETGGYIARALPDGVGNDHILLPYYALLSSRAEGSWFERLFAASGMTNRQDFLWSQIVSPAVELFHLLALDYGLASELHKQNLGLVVERSTGRIAGIYLRDLDALDINPVLRRTLRLEAPFEVPSWASQLGDVLRNDEAQIGQAFDFFYFGAMNLDQLAKGLLPPREASRLLGQVNRWHLDELNRRYGVRLTRLSQISRFWEGFHRRLMKSEEFERMPAWRRRNLRWYGLLRELELTLYSLWASTSRRSS